MTKSAGTHNYQRIGKVLTEIINEYDFHGKVRHIVTDNGCNFVKAFKEYSKERCDISKNKKKGTPCGTRVSVRDVGLKGSPFLQRDHSIYYPVVPKVSTQVKQAFNS